MRLRKAKIEHCKVEIGIEFEREREREKNRVKKGSKQSVLKCEILDQSSI